MSRLVCGQCGLLSLCGLVGLFGLLAGAGCAASPADGGELPGHTPGSPGLGAHALTFYRLGASTASAIETPAMATERTGSTMIVSVGRGQRSAFAPPTDNMGNAGYPQQGDVHAYTRWPDSGTAVYAVTGMAGGDGHLVRDATPQGDEITLAAVEVVEGVRVQAAEWNEVLEGAPLTSRSVTTTGPATLVAFWWGDGFPMTQQTAVPDNGFVVVDAILEGGSLVQCAAAVKNVDAAGTYDVTWTATPRQGAQLWLVAVQ